MPSPDPTPPSLPQRPATRSAAARLLTSTGRAPIAPSTPASAASSFPHNDSTGPEPAPSRANDEAFGPRHFRRADTWR